MRIQTILVIGVILLFGGLAIAQSNTTTNIATTTSVSAQVIDPVLGDVCPTTAQLEKDIHTCKENGLGYSTYVKGSCKYVQCTQQVTCQSKEELERSVQKCRSYGLDSEYYTNSNNCTAVACKNTSVTCDSRETLEKLATQCKERGLGYEFVKTDSGCATIQCTDLVKPACLTTQDIEKLAHACEEKGSVPTRYYDYAGCPNVQCNEKSVCPTNDQLESSVLRCKNSNLEYFTYADAHGCKQVKCNDRVKPLPTTVECKKQVDAKGCVNVSCNDGYYYNSCDQKQVCYDLEYKKYVDGKGCTHLVWSDGREEISCPNTSQTTCEVITKDNGCQVTECSDGTRKEYCPSNDRCRVEELDNGCMRKTCVDANGKQTYSANSCPTSVPGDVAVEKTECKLYKTDSGELEKTCSNGLVINYTDVKAACEKTGVQFDPENIKAGIKCALGDNSEYVVNANGVECVLNFSTQTQLCTDGTATKSGAAMTGPEPTSVPAPTTSPTGFDLFRFLRSIFGGN